MEDESFVSSEKPDKLFHFFVALTLNKIVLTECNFTSDSFFPVLLIPPLTFGLNIPEPFFYFQIDWLP